MFKLLPLIWCERVPISCSIWISTQHFFFLLIFQAEQIYIKKKKKKTKQRINNPSKYQGDEKQEEEGFRKNSFGDLRDKEKGRFVFC